MRILPVSSEALDQAALILKGGGVVVHPTETCYGLACDLTNPAAVKRMFEIKKRPPSQPVSALFSSLDATTPYVRWTPDSLGLAEEYLPGPLTIILALREDAPRVLYPTPEGGKTIGIRISSHSATADLAKRIGSPISTTSANIHQEPSPYTVEELITQYEKWAEPDLMLDAGELPQHETSTVVTCLHGICTVVREGDIRI